MNGSIIKIAELLDSSENVEGKLNIIDVCYDIIEVIHDGSRESGRQQNVLVVEKIIENMLNKLDHSISAESFIKTLYKYIYRVNMLVTPDTIYKIKIIEENYSKKMEHSSYVRIIDSFDDLDLLEKSCITIVYKQYSGFLTEGAYKLFGATKADEIKHEFVPKSLGILTTSLDAAMIDDEMTIDDYITGLHSELCKASKDIYLNKYKEGSLDLSKCSRANLFAGKPKKEAISLFVSNIYDITSFINEKESDNEYIKDCSDLLGISEEEYRESCLLPGRVSYLTLTKLLRKINSNKKEEE